MEEASYYTLFENKGADQQYSYACAASLICVFVFAYAEVVGGGGMRRLINCKLAEVVGEGGGCGGSLIVN